MTNLQKWLSTITCLTCPAVEFCDEDEKIEFACSDEFLKWANSEVQNDKS